ncbi:hypothetical protein UVI_02042640 [Ustilaginoidea virens]|uniref:Uncharacterized protein n=1 Tax=Ustilaginoidea virens TaxID=1159556 RepID=A0A1B5L3E0_USTVR|nr:hypothetical protein UVI_02042640 [Ustilaginoidea virens]
MLPGDCGRSAIGAGRCLCKSNVETRRRLDNHRAGNGTARRDSHRGSHAVSASKKLRERDVRSRRRLDDDGAWSGPARRDGEGRGQAGEGSGEGDVRPHQRRLDDDAAWDCAAGRDGDCRGLAVGAGQGQREGDVETSRRRLRNGARNRRRAAGRGGCRAQHPARASKRRDGSSASDAVGCLLVQGQRDDRAAGRLPPQEAGKRSRGVSAAALVAVSGTRDVALLEGDDGGAAVQVVAAVAVAGNRPLVHLPFIHAEKPLGAGSGADLQAHHLRGGDPAEAGKAGPGDDAAVKRISQDAAGRVALNSRRRCGGSSRRGSRRGSRSRQGAARRLRCRGGDILRIRAGRAGTASHALTRCYSPPTVSARYLLCPRQNVCVILAVHFQRLVVYENVPCAVICAVGSSSQ